MKNISREKSGVFGYLVLLCSVAYYVSYVSRLNLGACMVEMVNVGFAARNTVALALSACSVTYGAGQIVSGWLGDKYKPQNVMLFGFILTAAMNLGVAFIRTPAPLVALWAVNGFAQALMWPPLVAILTRFLNHEQYSRAVMYVSWASAIGTITVYLLTPVFITISTYRMVFVMSGAMAIVMGVVWKWGYDRRFKDAIGIIPSGKTAQAAQEKPVGRIGAGVLFMLGLIMVAIVLQGALRDGVTNWMPTFVSESFNLGSSVAILTGVLLPIFHIICSRITSRVYRYFMGRETLYAGIIFAIGTAAALLMSVAQSSVVITSLLTAILVGCMHGVNYVLVCMVPLYFKKFGHISLISGVINSSTYVGNAVSTYGIAIFSVAFGWRATILLWAAIAGGGMLICFGLVRKWKKFAEE